MALSGLAEKLLESHGREPNKLFYNIDVFGPVSGDSEERALDEAYRELAAAGYMEPARAFVSFFGSPKSLYRITAAGLAHLQKVSAA